MCRIWKITTFLSQGSRFDILWSNIQALLIFDPLITHGIILKPLILKCSMMPTWHQLVHISGHAEESETAIKLQLLQICASLSTRLISYGHLFSVKMTLEMSKGQCCSRTKTKCEHPPSLPLVSYCLQSVLEWHYMCFTIELADNTLKLLSGKRYQAESQFMCDSVVKPTAWRTISDVVAFQFKLHVCFVSVVTGNQLLL